MKKAILTLTVLACCLGAFAQNTITQQEWVATYSSQDSIYNTATAIGVNGFVYVTGYTYSFATNADFTTIKYDSLGNIVWVQSYNGLGNARDRAVAIGLDMYSNVYVTGPSTGANGDIESCEL